jgi:hypothetical protein
LEFVECSGIRLSDKTDAQITSSGLDTGYMAAPKIKYERQF